MPVQSNLTALFLCFGYKSVMISGYKIIMSVCNQNLMPFQDNLLFIRKICKKIIIPCDNSTWTFCQSLNKNLSALYISAMNEIFKRSFSEHSLFQILILSMCIADDQYLHFSSSFMARKALPLWLILFFSSMESSADVQPYSGR